MENNIFVTRPLLPPLVELMPYLEKIWENQYITNGGPFHEMLEQELAAYLGVKYLSLFGNGTLALLTALQALRISGEVITTPYSFVATSHSLLWNGLKPVFVDIDPINCNLDPSKIEAAITPETSAILPVHCYGVPCNVDAIQKIADAYGIKVIYDAAHAFGVKKQNASILNYGDLSILSFHATKVFNTIEGGAIICHDKKMKQRIDYLKNFGFADETTVVAAGINSKMNEVQAAYGLLQLKYIDDALDVRMAIYDKYVNAFAGIPQIRMIKNVDDIRWNYAYFPIFFEECPYSLRDIIYNELKERNIYSRRYFFPLISSFPMYRGLNSANSENLPIATDISSRVLCLPIYPGLSLEEQDRVILSIKEIIKKHI
ncbi:DegT/DnrJ/EryC1/StrS family aminotransferase [Dickeya oryzae]|uniref:DegT/DnrJ/EryC1/StrS family aminotransferase n=1 Tax=Dickeya oryzae TaxID=1240404 RepID=UPI0020968324|nr:DegT/DnrJ/EryC1/StrS family aminotransferase [Dickeya oryzae]MCO7256120.1 DegT/DnrJ/EryC1/StrS family aminotransferase [Dickeya oryzae]